MKEKEEKEKGSCSACCHADLSFNLFYCRLHRKNVGALESCPKWEAEEVCLVCKRVLEDCVCHYWG